jgi:L-fuconolactonase
VTGRGVTAGIVDAHQHFWDPAKADYPWLTDELAAIRRPFGPADLAPHLEARGVGRTILVQTRSSAAETAGFLALAEATPFVAGVVGWVDLTQPDVADRIARLRAGPGGRNLVGIRHQVHDEPDPDWLGRADVRTGIAAVGAAGLAYDLLVRQEHLPAALAVVRALPEVRFVVDHLAKPPIASGRLEPWASRLRPLGALANAWCKISGMVTEADPMRWRPADLQPYVDRALDVFGPGRLLFGSDWPVCLLAGQYEVVFDATVSALGGLTASERDAVFGRTADEVYRLAAEGSPPRVDRP